MTLPAAQPQSGNLPWPHLSEIAPAKPAPHKSMAGLAVFPALAKSWWMASFLQYAHILTPTPGPEHARWDIPKTIWSTILPATSSISMDFCKSQSHYIISIDSSKYFHSGGKQMSLPCVSLVSHFMSFQKPPSVSAFPWQLGAIQSFFAFHSLIH